VITTDLLTRWPALFGDPIHLPFYSASTDILFIYTVILTFWWLMMVFNEGIDEVVCWSVFSVKPLLMLTCDDDYSSVQWYLRWWQWRPMKPVFLLGSPVKSVTESQADPCDHYLGPVILILTLWAHWWADCDVWRLIAVVHCGLLFGRWCLEVMSSVESDILMTDWSGDCRLTIMCLFNDLYMRKQLTQWSW